jgi:hypothetical protein
MRELDVDDYSPKVSQNDGAMTEPEWNAELRRQLEAADEAQVRAELRELSIGGEDRRQFVVGWLREKEKTRKKWEDWLYWGTLAVAGLTLAAIVAGIVATVIAH